MTTEDLTLDQTLRVALLEDCPTMGEGRFAALLLRVVTAAEAWHASAAPEPMKEARALRLFWGKHERDGEKHIEWYAPCGCAYHPEPEPHVHPCSEHRKTGITTEPGEGQPERVRRDTALHDLDDGFQEGAWAEWIASFDKSKPTLYESARWGYAHCSEEVEKLAWMMNEKDRHARDAAEAARDAALARVDELEAQICRK